MITKKNKIKIMEKEIEKTLISLSYFVNEEIKKQVELSIDIQKYSDEMFSEFRNVLYKLIEESKHYLSVIEKTNLSISILEENKKLETLLLINNYFCNHFLIENKFELK